MLKSLINLIKKPSQKELEKLFRYLWESDLKGISRHVEYTNHPQSTPPFTLECHEVRLTGKGHIRMYITKSLGYRPKVSLSTHYDMYCKIADEYNSRHIHTNPDYVKIVREPVRIDH